MTADLRLLVPAAVAWIAAAWAVATPAAAFAVALALWAASVTLLIAARVSRRGWVVVATVCATAAALVCSAACVQQQVRHPYALVEAAAAGRFVTVTLTTSETIGRAPAGLRSSPYAATATEVSTGGGVAAARRTVVTVSTPVLVFGGRPAHRTGIGSTLTLSGTLRATQPEDDSAYLLFASGAPRDIRAPPWFLDWANGLRSSFSAAASALPGAGGDLLPGLAIGDTSAVSETLNADMKASSLSHLTAVSGANCAVVIALIMLLGGFAGVGRGVRVVASAIVLVGFVVLVTPQASVIRAAVMAGIVLLALLAGRPVRGIPVLALATLVLLAADPWLARDYGFALSVLATGGLLVLSGPLMRLLARFLPLGIAGVIAVPVAAQVACQPVLLLLNPTIPLYGVVANVLAEPAAPVATVVGLLACVTLPVVPVVGGLLARVAWLPSSWIAAVAHVCSGLPGAALPWPEGLGGVLLLFVVTVAALVAVLGGVARRARLVCAAVAVVVLVGFGGASAGIRVVQQLARPGDWQIAACDIGQGDAVLVRSAGEVALIDTGPDPKLLAACLDSLGIGHIDLLMLSHYDLDHVGGTSAVVGRVGRALVGPPAEADDERLAAQLANAGARVQQASRGLSGTLGELRWQVLWPRARLGSVEPGNAASVTVAFAPVGRCATGCLSSLFLGDLGEQAQSLVLAAGPLPHVDVVKVSHHGSADQSARLYQSIRATVGVISVGANNDYGHPTQKLLNILAGAGTVAARTDREGLVLLSPGEKPGSVRVWTQKRAAAP